MTITESPSHVQDRLPGMGPQEEPILNTDVAARHIAEHTRPYEPTTRTSEAADNEGWGVGETQDDRTLHYMRAARTALEQAVEVKPTRWDRPQ